LCCRAEQAVQVEAPYPFGQAPAFLLDGCADTALMGLYY
jgi:hypothetical protein